MSITRDTRPIDPEDQLRRQRLNDLARALRSLHAGLLESVKADYANLHGPIGGPLKVFQLVTSDPFFAWLRTLSGAMANLDERIDDKTKLNDGDLRNVHQQMSALFISHQLGDFANNLNARASEASIAPLLADVQAVVAGLVAAQQPA
jgi:hypothetical protein